MTSLKRRTSERGASVGRLTRHLAGAAVALAALSMVAPAPAAAQEVQTSIQVEQFEPLPDQHTNILNVATAETLGHLVFTTGAFLHFVGEPLRLVQVNDSNDEETERSTVIDNQFKGEVWAGLGLSEYFDLGVVLPVIFTQSGDGFDPSNGPSVPAVDGANIGDLRIVPRVKALPREYAGGFGIAVESIFYAPTGDQDSFNGEDGFRVEPRLVLDYLHDLSGFHIAYNVGYLIRERHEVLNLIYDDVVRMSLGMGIPLGVDGLQLIGTVFGSIQTVDNVDPISGGEADDFRTSPWEADGGIRYTAPFGLHASLGGGSGLNNAVGAPSWRVFASIGFLSLDTDYDDDGIVNDEDSCPEVAEDFDNWEDEDGCPEETDDTDGDGILNVVDACIEEPEDFDQWEDEDGCPETNDDADGDGIINTADACIDDPEDFDQFEDEDGCPELDNDGDGILDTADACPIEPEDLDQFQDEDGCPDPDNDGDGILDVADLCPLEPEVVNNVKDEDGCPDEVMVVVTEKKLEILEQVFFATNKATIKKQSYPLLDDVAKVLIGNPQITKVRVEGHTDDVGKDKYNLKLSQDRADSVVKYLVGKGVEPERLQGVGYGEDQPIVPNDSDANRALNRRVEFRILEVDGKPVEQDY